MRKMPAARLAEGCVLELRRRPPEILLWGRQGQPGREVLLGGPPAQVGANLGEQPQGTVGADGGELGEIDAGQLVERGANVESGLIVTRLLFRPRGRQRASRGGRLGGQRLDVGLDRGIARGQLALIGVEEFEILLQDEDVLGAVMPGEGGRDLGRRGLTPVVAMLGKGVGVVRPATMSRTMRSPVTPVMSLITTGSWRFI